MSNPAESYDNYVVPALFAHWADDLIARVSPGAGDRIIDVASGTGIVARRAAAAAGNSASVAAVDPNPGMLAAAEIAAQQEGVEIRLHECRAEVLPFQDDAFDIAFCQQGLQFFTDRQAGLNEMARVLDSQGRVAVSTWQSIEKYGFFAALNESMQRHLGSSAASAPFQLHDPAELKSLMASAGFEDIEVTQASKVARYPEPDRFLSETLNGLKAVVVSMAGINERELQEGLDAVTRELQEPLRELVEMDHVVLGWHSNVALAVNAG